MVTSGSQAAAIEGQYTVAMGAKNGLASNTGYVMDFGKLTPDTGDAAIREGKKYMFGLQFPTAPDDVCITMEIRYSVG